MIGVGGYTGEYLDSRTWRQLNLLSERLSDGMDYGLRGQLLRAGIRL